MRITHMFAWWTVTTLACGGAPEPLAAAPAIPATVPLPARAVSETQATRLRALVDALVGAPFGTGAALSVAVGDRDFSYAAGHLWDGGPAVDDRTRFNVASVSKLLTAAKVVSLAHAQRLALDDSVKHHLPGVMLRDQHGNDRAGDVSIRQLLMHRGGLPHHPDTLDPHRVGAEWNDPDLLQRLTRSWSIPLSQSPGTYTYSNLGYALLAAIVEAAERQPFAETMQPFLTLLGMPESTFWPTPQMHRAAHGRVEREGSVHFNEPGWYTSRYASSFSGLWSSMPDLTRFGRALIEAETNDGAPLHAMTVFEGERGHGVGPVVRRRYGARSLEHDGGGPGFLAWLVVIPEHELVLAIACNGDGDTGEVAKPFSGIVDHVLEILHEPAAQKGSTDLPSRSPG